jgi:hypothetical protein
MTTTVTIEAHCTPDIEVHVIVNMHAGYSGEEHLVLQNGDTAERCVYDTRSITIYELAKSRIIG